MCKGVRTGTYSRYWEKNTYIFTNTDYLVQLWDVFWVWGEKLCTFNGTTSTRCTKPRMMLFFFSFYNPHKPQTLAGFQNVQVRGSCIQCLALGGYTVLQSVDQTYFFKVINKQHSHFSFFGGVEAMELYKNAKIHCI